jgi:hypothetical protein
VPQNIAATRRTGKQLNNTMASGTARSAPSAISFYLYEIKRFDRKHLRLDSHSPSKGGHARRAAQAART